MTIAECAVQLIIDNWPSRNAKRCITYLSRDSCRNLGIYQAEVRHLIQQIHLQIMMELDMLMTNPLLIAGANDNLP